MLAFSTISHSGTILAGIALLSPEGLAGAMVLLLGQGLLKGALFMLVGRLLDRHGTTDIRELYGRGRHHPFHAGVFFVATLGMTGLPGFVSWAGKSFFEHALHLEGLGWTKYPLLLASALSGAALLSAGAHVFLGWGPRPEEEADEPARGSDEHSEQAPTLEMLVAPTLLVALAISLTFVDELGPKSERWATVLTEPSITLEKVLRGTTVAIHPPGHTHLQPRAIFPGLIACAVAMALASGWLARKKLPRRMRRLGEQLTAPVHAIQSGDVCDYVLWMSVGMAAVGAVLVLNTG